MKQKGPQFKRTQYYVLPKFQNHFMLLMACQVLLIFGGMIVPQYRILSSYISRMEAGTNSDKSTSGLSILTDQDPSESKDVQELVLIRNSIFMYSIFFILTTSLVFGFYCSHRLGGPIYKTILYLRKYREGTETSKLKFRDGDFFHELAVEVNKVLEHKFPNDKDAHK